MTTTTLTVSEIRSALLAQTGFASGDGATSLALLGTLFHDCATALASPHSHSWWGHSLDPSRLESAAAPKLLLNRLYEQFLGPQLIRHRYVLLSRGREVYSLWQALESFADWFTGVLRQAHGRGLLQFANGQWSGLDQIILLNHSLRWELDASLAVQGEADALFLDPQTNRWCVVEFKLGAGSPEADLAQACLYHRMLTDSLSPDGSLCVLWFKPALDQRLFTAADVEPAQAALESLIRALAGPLPAPAEPRFLDESQRLVTTFREMGVDLKLTGEPLAGPSFVRYQLMPRPGVSVRSITAKADDLQVQMGLPYPPIIHIVKGRVTADLARADRQPLSLNRIALVPGLLAGVDVAGQPQYIDLTDSTTPHLLVAGVTGSGKSEWLRLAVASLLLGPQPEAIKLVLIDPKRNAFLDFRDSSHLWRPDSLILPDEGSAEDILDALIEEMERRYLLFDGARDLSEYASRTGQQLDRIVLLCDEYGDLVAEKKRKEAILERVKRLGQKSRAAGIHLILATQRPDRTVVDGIIKANLPGRVCLTVTNSLESRIVLDEAGAEKLTGKGDLLLKRGGESIRLQAPLVDATSWQSLLTMPQ